MGDLLVEKITAKDLALIPQMIAVTAMEVMNVVHQKLHVELAKEIVILILTVNLDLLVEKITAKDLALIPQMIAVTAMEVMNVVHQKLHVERTKEIVTQMLTVNLE